MNEADALDLVSFSAWTVLVCGGPAVSAAMAIGVSVALLQALTQVQEMTLTFVPKMIIICLVIGVSSNAIGSHFLSFTEHVYGKIEKGFAY